MTVQNTQQKTLQQGTAQKSVTKVNTADYQTGSYGSPMQSPYAPDPASVDADNTCAKGKVSTSNANFRKAPSTASGVEIIRKLAAGTSFDILERDGLWLHVRVGSETGYLHVSVTDQCSSSDDINRVEDNGRQAGLLGNIDTNKLELARFDANQSMFDNVTRAVSAVETECAYGTTGDIGDGAGLSVGGYQFTEASSLYLLVEKYISLGGSVSFSDDIQKKLVAAANGTPLSISDRKTVKELLDKAYATDKNCYIQAQKNAWKENYFDPCTKRMKKHGLDPETLDPKICVLIYDHENSGCGNNENLMKILAKRYGDGKTIDQSRLTLENVAESVQSQFQQCGNYNRWGDGWNNRVMTLYAAMSLPAQSSGNQNQTPQPVTTAPVQQPAPVTEAPAPVTETPAPVTEAPAPVQQSASFEIGSEVQVTGTYYSDSKTKVPGWVKTQTYTIIQLQSDRALLSSIISWVKLTDLKLVGAAAPATVPEQPLSQPEQPVSQTEQPVSQTEQPIVQTPSTPQTKADELLLAHPELKTNQNLINYFYGLGGDYNGAAIKAKEYGFDLGKLCNARSAAITRPDGNTAVSSGSTGNQTTAGVSVSTSSNGVPLYSQSDPQWKDRMLGKKYTIGSSGCAMCAVAMAISKIAGRNISPVELDEYLDNNGGYDGDGIYWDKAARYGGSSAASYPSTTNMHDQIDSSLAAGRPCIIHVVTKRGHYVCVTGKNDDGTYTIHDPAGGVVRSGVWDSNQATIVVDGYGSYGGDNTQLILFS